jgi:hypothetical protein
MIIPSFKRILNTDYAAQFQQLINTLGFSLNNAITNINQALANNISLQDNILCTVKTFNVQVDATGKPTTSTTFPLTFTGQCLGISLINVLNTTTSSAYPTGGVTISWTQTQSGVQLNNITGLATNNTYSITVIAWGNG